MPPSRASNLIVDKLCLYLEQDDKNVAYLTHVSEMQKKIETLARITTILKDVIHNKVRYVLLFCPHFVLQQSDPFSILEQH